MLSVVKMLLKGEVGSRALNSHGNYIVDHGKSWKNHGIVFLSFCGNPVQGLRHGSWQLYSCRHHMTLPSPLSEVEHHHAWHEADKVV